MYNRASALGVAALILGLLIAGCGGESEQDSKLEVDAACLQSNKKAGSIIKKAHADLEAEGITENKEIQLELNTYVPTLIDDAESQIAAISTLDTDKNRVAEILGAYRAWITKAESTPFKVVAVNDVFKKARGLAEQYGLPECGEDPFAFVYSRAFVN